MDAVSSRDTLDRFTPLGSPRTYLLAPLTYRQRQAFRADLAREGGLYPSQSQFFEVIRRVVGELAPENAGELLALVDAAEADPRGEDRETHSRLTVLEANIADQPAYAALLAARVRYSGMIPFVAARHALRGWEGPDLPEFALERGVVPETLLEAIPQAEMQAIGNRAAALMRPGDTAAGN